MHINDQIRFCNLVAIVKQLLGNKACEVNRYIGKVLSDIYFFVENKILDKAHYESNKLIYLIDQLKIINGWDNKAFKIFKSKIINCKNEAEYFGIRMEILTAASLCLHKIFFQLQESPDFSISFFDIYIECTSVHTKNTIDKDTGYKVLSAINKKNKKPYANHKTALSIDTTNILHNDIKNNRHNSSNPSQKEALIAGCNYGSILSFAVSQVSNNITHFGYVRSDNDHLIDIRLKSFLDIYYPINHVIRLPFCHVPFSP